VSELRMFRVRNWEKFQHYKDRNPPWIKLHTELLDNYEFSRLQDASKLLALCIWMLAARSDNQIPADPEWIQRRCNLKGKPDLDPLFSGNFIEWIQPLAGMEQDASKALADCKQDACSEERRDRGETEGVAVVFDHWKEVHGHPKAKIDTKRHKLIRSALAIYSADDLKKSISGYKHSPHHMGQNENKTVYDDIELFLRDAKHIDAGLKLFDKGSTPQWQ
jgi:hypothetical protein